MLNDVSDLAFLLKKQLGNKIEIEICGNQIVVGKYHCLLYDKYDGSDEYEHDTLEFNFSFVKDNYLEVSIGDGIHRKSFIHKLAAISTFFEILSLEFKSPSLFYSSKDDDYLTLKWCFYNTKEEFSKLKKDNFFSNKEVSNVVVIDELDNKFNMISDDVKKAVSKNFGLPFELVDFALNDIDEFLRYKKGRKVRASMNMNSNTKVLTLMKEKQAG